MLIIRSDPRLPPPAHVLAGVDDILTKCHDFCRRMFALYDAGAVAGRMSAFFLSKVELPSRHYSLGSSRNGPNGRGQDLRCAGNLKSLATGSSSARL